MFSCLQILEAFLWFVLITLLNVTLIILTLSVSRLLNLLLRLVAFLLFLNPQCLASISRWITASSSWKRFCLFVCRALSSIMVICMLTAIRLLLTFVIDRKSGSAGMPRPISYAVFCLKKKIPERPEVSRGKRMIDQGADQRPGHRIDAERRRAGAIQLEVDRGRRIEGIRRVRKQRESRRDAGALRLHRGRDPDREEAVGEAGQHRHALDRYRAHLGLGRLVRRIDEE